MSKQLTTLSINCIKFPDPELALDDPDGLLAVGGDLSSERLINAYQHAIFPWFSDADPILWWSPAERAIIEPQQVHISKSMSKFIRRMPYTVTVNHAFHEVINACSLPRKTQAETWITTDIQAAYQNLHHLGFAHSIEVWNQHTLVGGLYGVNIGGIFCGESMFHQQTNASKIAFIALCQHFSSFDGQLIDCQMVTPHLQSLGVKANTRTHFLKQLQRYKNNPIAKRCWQKQHLNFNL